MSRGERCDVSVIPLVEGDRIRLFVTNKLGELTRTHWHGQRLPNDMMGTIVVTPAGKAGSGAAHWVHLQTTELSDARRLQSPRSAKSPAMSAGRSPTEAGSAGYVGSAVG